MSVCMGGGGVEKKRQSGVRCRGGGRKRETERGCGVCLFGGGVAGCGVGGGGRKERLSGGAVSVCMGEGSRERESGGAVSVCVCGGGVG